MIAIITENGHLRIAADLPIPNARKGQWTPARIAKLMRLIEDMHSAAELVDGTEADIEAANRLGEPVTRKHNYRSSLVVVDGGTDHA